MASNSFPFLYIGQKNAVFRMFDTSPVPYDSLKLMARVGDMCVAISLRILVVMLSGPGALWTG